MTEKRAKLPSTSVFNEYVSIETFEKREGLAPSVVVDDQVLQIHQAKERTTYCVKGRSKQDFVFSPSLLKSFTQVLNPTAYAYDCFVDEFVENDSFSARVNSSLRYPFDEWAYTFGNSIVKKRSQLKRKEKALAKAKELAARIGLPTYSRMQLNSDTGAIHSVPEYPCWLLDSLELSF
jgi:hypothetical protein